MSNKLKLIRTQIKTDFNAYVGNYTWVNKVEIDRTTELSQDETLHANITLGDLSPIAEFVGGAENEWQRSADIDVEIEKGGGTLTGDEILDAVADFEAIVKANKQWSTYAGKTEWLGTSIQKDQQERKIYVATIKLRIHYTTMEWSTE